MPHITVESGKLTEEQKRNLIERYYGGLFRNHEHPAGVLQHHDP